MANTVGLPVFAYKEDAVQVAELRDFLISLGADMKKEGNESMLEDVEELVENCALIGAKLDNDNEVEMTLNSIVSLIVPLPPDMVHYIEAGPSLAGFVCFLYCRSVK